MKSQPEPSTSPENVVVVDSLTQEYGLLYLQADGNYGAGDIRPIYGGNNTEGSVYTNGSTPKDWRSAVDTGDYENEVCFVPLPDLMEELIPEDYCRNGEPVMVRVITNCKVIQMPTSDPQPEPACRIIEHPAASEFQRVNPEGFKQQAATVAPQKPKKPDKGYGTLKFPFAENDSLTINQTA